MAQKDSVKHDAYTRFLLDVLDEFGHDYTEDPQYPLAELARSQVREARNVAPPEMVMTFRAKLQNGQTLAAIIATADGEIIDGNTRQAAYLKEKRPTGYVIVTRKTAAEIGPTELRVLGQRMNDHGKRLSKAETEATIRKMVADGATTERIAQHCSVPTSRVSEIRAMMRGEDRLAEVGLAANGFKLAHLRALGRADLLDRPFTELARLSLDAGLSAPDVAGLAKRVRAEGSEEAQIRLLDNERQALADQIHQHKLTGNGKPPAARRAKQSLSQFLAATETPETVVERAPERMEEQLRTLRQSAERLQALIEVQEAAAVAAGVILL